MRLLLWLDFLLRHKWKWLCNRVWDWQMKHDTDWDALFNAWLEDDNDQRFWQKKNPHG